MFFRIMNLDNIKNFTGKISIKDAMELQTELSGKVIRKNGFKKLKIISGIDLSVIKEDKKLICGIVSFSYPEFEIIERVSKVVYETFPYIPGLLSFREGPAILQTLKELNHEPDLMVFDGQGIAHPRGLGIASFIGVLTDKPSFGIAKKRLFGEYTEPERESGSTSNLYHPEDKSVIGAALRTKKNVKPVFVSVGHKISLDKSVELALE
ncbi:MAG: endonuclease V, partial [Candidatus Dadabacteria bacterium]|nr:endonuclease V [Candidatus Dadabacteria bacterium]NIS09211.1 endonuclease V [Candidatus Dadabacteria bacterium]NIV43195.1 endonuclease V [Candidatus Dadabacteria bacterium]NIY22261.1 endonuclease V [Candidatus Dadabacteria bacterium]